MIPIQEFSKSSDIDWSLSISQIDKQLYEKYDLNNQEMQFLDVNVKEME